MVANVASNQPCTSSGALGPTIGFAFTGNGARSAALAVDATAPTPSEITAPAKSAAADFRSDMT